MIYLPDEIYSYNCAYVYDKDTIRVYEYTPVVNSTINYTDYFINSHYITRTGTTSFGQWSTINYDCLNYTDFTTNSLYRNDFPSALLIASIFIFFCYYLIRTLVRRLCYGRKII